ncbi:MAG: FtsQ-type POTRA domain-containing protein [Clostridia bacterium]|nr:FtsQ-type POTRA domain-containing protein [Clostridia bacterium]
MASDNGRKGRGTTRPDSPQNNKRGFARGNDTWNTDRYRASVRTENSSTRVLRSASITGIPLKAEYYDNTPAAVRAKRLRELEERREKWKEAVKKNRRTGRIGRRLLSFLVIVLSVIVASGAVYKLFFIASDITVYGSSEYTEEQVISAAGLDKRVNLFSFSSRVAGDSIRFYCPKIAATSFDRTVPNKVKIEVVEEPAVFYAQIYGDLYGISDSLRITGKITEDETEGLIKLKLQTVSTAIAGGKIALCSERAQSFLEKANEVLAGSPLKSRLTQIDMRNDFNVTMVADDKYKLLFGTQDDFEIKVRLAVSVLKDEVFASGSKATINLEDTTKTSVIIDNQLVFD